MKKQVTVNSICLPSDDVVAREIEGDIVIVPLIAGIGDTDDELYTLNETGKAIWKKLDGQKTLKQISVELTEEFSSPSEEIQVDVLGFVDEMVRRRILTVKQ